MKSSLPLFLLSLILLLLTGAVFSSAKDSSIYETTGVLILAHGHQKDWNRQIETLARRLPFPVEVAFGMAHKSSISRGITQLEKKGVRNIVVVPLYVSSYSPIIRASAYLLGLVEQAPPELEMFNTMSHGLQDPRPAHGGRERPLDLSPIRSDVPIQMTSALDDHPLVAQILLDRARSVSTDPEREIVILVAHGPNTKAEDEQWQEKMSHLASVIRGQSEFAGVEALTMMDDAPKEVRDGATVRLRARVEAAADSGCIALVVPVLLSHGGIEGGLKARLRGLKYRMPSQFLLPDPRVADWVKDQVEQATRGQPVVESPQ